MTGPDAGARDEHGHATHDELVAAVAALLAAARRGSGTGTRPSGERAWRAGRLAALGLTPRDRARSSPATEYSVVSDAQG